MAVDKIKKKVQSPKEKEKVEFLLDIWDEAYNYKKDTILGKRGIRFNELHRGAHWDATKVKRGKAAVAVNKIGATIEDILANITDSPPSFDAVSKKEQWDGNANDLRDILNNYLWVRDTMTTKIQKAMRNALVYGSGFLCTWCEGSELIGPRKIHTERLSPYCVFPEPGAEYIQESNYFIKANIVKKMALIERYGEKAKDIQNSGRASYDFLPDMDKEAAKGIFAGIANACRQVTAGLGIISHKAADVDDMEKCLLLEIWMKDLQAEKDGTRLYPTWRHYVLAEDTLLEDKAWPYPFIPVIKIDDYSTDGFWGMGEIEWLESIQYLVNKFISQICNYMDMLANPILLTGKHSGIPNDWINLPGSIARVSPEFLAGTKFLNVPPLPPEFLVLVDRLIRLMNDISGQHASPGTSMRTATQAAIFKESEMQRTRMKVQNMEVGLTEWAYQMKEYIKQHWVSAQTIRYRDRDGNIVTKTWEVENKAIVDDLDIVLTAGSTLSSSRFLKLQEIKGVPGIDTEEVLKAMNYPGWEQVVKRLGEKEKLGKEVQMIQGQLMRIVAENKSLQSALEKFQRRTSGQ